MNEETVRGLIQAENEMINQRMNWFLILQGFMFAGIAFGWDKSIALSLVFSFVGVLSSLSVGILLHLGVDAIKNLQKASPATAVGKRHDEVSKFVHWLLPWNFLPLLFIVAWATIAFIRSA